MGSLEEEVAAVHQANEELRAQVEALTVRDPTIAARHHFCTRMLARVGLIFA